MVGSDVTKYIRSLCNKNNNFNKFFGLRQQCVTFFCIALKDKYMCKVRTLQSQAYDRFDRRWFRLDYNKRNY